MEKDWGRERGKSTGKNRGGGERKDVGGSLERKGNKM